MKKIISLFVLLVITINAQDYTKESKEAKDLRMQWWRDARFGLFIHWGLYAIPAGEWNGSTNHAEWIRTTAQIPLKEYYKFVEQFNPVKFDAEEWVKMAKDAGMKYIVITSKHHDGFSLFDSKHTEFDVMSTPFKRDILKELSDACRKYGLKICWYHSIMDWHHPDYLPRREWETDRSAEGSDFTRFFQYLKNQLKELLTNYGEIGVLWFDGEWEDTWNSNYGIELYNYVRSLQPDIIINNRVGVGRSGMEGLTKAGEFGGDFGTPEQQIPSTGLPGVDWEACITMNNYWGYNKFDKDFKSTKELLQMLVDITSKGGNFLLNVGPTAEGLFPQESIIRLKEIGEWINLYGESIYGTEASPFNYLEWGRCTKKIFGNNTRLYLHVFNWPKDAKLVVPGILNEPIEAYVLSDKQKVLLHTTRNEDAIVINVPLIPPDENVSVIVLDIEGKDEIINPPAIINPINIFIDKLDVIVNTDRNDVEVRYTTDGTTPTINSDIYKDRIELRNTSIITVRSFRNGKPVSNVTSAAFTKVIPEKPVKVENPNVGVSYFYYEGIWENLPDFDSLEPVKKGTTSNFDITLRNQNDYFGFQYTGYVLIPRDDVYTFYTDSDDGSKLYIGDKLIVDNDGLHGMQEKKGIAALSKGFHPLKVLYFERSVGNDLKVLIEGGGIKKQIIPDSMLFNGR
jgi:alpha-L-fucosidase